MARRVALGLMVAAVAACSLAPAAAAKTETRRSGLVKATLTYQGKKPPFRKHRLVIEDAGLVVLDAAVKLPCRACRYGVESSHRLRLRDLDNDDQPEVLIDFFTGGGHCCLHTVIYYDVAERSTYDRVTQQWGHAGYRLRDLRRDGTVELVSAESAFAYAFASYADSAFPISIWRFQDRRVIDVTRKFRREVARDARKKLRQYRRARRARRDVRGVLAAYVADQYLLRRSKRGWRLVKRALRRGELTGRRAPRTWPRGRRYIRALRKFLRQAGYTRRR